MNQIPAWVDTETWSSVDLLKFGTDNNTSAPDFHVQMWQYAIDAGPVTVWVPTIDPYLLGTAVVTTTDLQDEVKVTKKRAANTVRMRCRNIEKKLNCKILFQVVMPADLKEILTDAKYQIRTHNVQYDRTAISRGAGIHIPLSRWYCTMTQAMSAGFPGALGRLGPILGVDEDQAKIKDGKRLINMFCKPAPKSHKVYRYTYAEKPEDYAKFIEYGVMDVVSMRETSNRVPDYAYGTVPAEMKLYEITEEMNEHGVSMDLTLCDLAIERDLEEKQTIRDRCSVLTKGVIDSPTRKTFKEYMEFTYGLELPNVQGSTINALIAAGGLDPVAEELLNLKLMIGKTSVGKYKKAKALTGDDGIFRNYLSMNGAPRTHRFASRGLQFHNMPSRNIPKNDQLEDFIAKLKAGRPVCCPEGELPKYLSGAIRYLIRARPGCMLLDSDWSSIEGVLAAWVTGETWKIKAYVDKFNGIGEDIYKLTAAMILNIAPEDVTKQQRTDYGKPAELGLGYQGGVGAFLTFAKVYNVDLDAMQLSVLEALDPEVLHQAEYNWTKWGKRMSRGQIHPKTWLAAEAVKLRWRATNPATVALWYKLDDCIRKAIAKPEKVFHINDKLRCKVINYGGVPVLIIQLPSGMLLTYWDVHVRRKDEEDEHDKGAIAYYGVESDPGSPRKGQWTYLTSFGGKFLENICQSMSRDILRDFLIRAWKHPDFNWDLLFHVHDQIVAECPKGDAEYLAVKFTEMMNIRPDWGPDIPLACETSIVPTFRKT